VSGRVVSDADAIDDDAWFDRNPGRRYRLRPGWVVRRRRDGILLRSPLPADQGCTESEAEAERIWWRAAWPQLAPRTRAKLLKAARRKAARSAARLGETRPRYPKDQPPREGLGALSGARGGKS
jgi:hypothetical protein